MLKIRPIKQINGSYCGPASAQMILAFWGIKRSQKTLAKLCQTTMAKGTENKNIVNCLKKLGFKVKYGERGNWAILNEFVNKEKVPVIVSWFYEDWGHKSAVVGLDKKNIWLAEPYEGKILKMPWSTFNQVWFCFDDKFPKTKNIISNFYLVAQTIQIVV